MSIYFDYNVCFDLCYFALAGYSCFDFPLTFYNWAYCVGESFAVNNFAVENWMSILILCGSWYVLVIVSRIIII